MDVGQVKLPHFFDLLSVIETARVFVTLDTGTLHLAAACETPVVALVMDGHRWKCGTMWRSAIPRYNCAARLTYGQVQADPDLVVEAIRSV